MLRVTPIYGSRWSLEGQAEEPTCTLIDFSGCRVLLNVGWWGYHQSSSNNSKNNNNNNHNAEQQQSQSQSTSSLFPDELPEHDCLVLTDSTIQSIGGLPMYYRQMKQKQQQKQQQQQEQPLRPIIIYATWPTVKMGQMTLYDQHACICMDGGTPPYTLQDVDDAVAAIHSIKYSQSMYIPPAATTTTTTTGIHNGAAAVASSTHTLQKHAKLSVTAFRAGHVVGAAFYVLQRLQDETVVVLTESTYHIAKEKHLDSSTLLQHGSTPDVLVTRPGGPALRFLKALAHPQQQKNNNHKKSFVPLPPVLVTQAERQLTELIMAVLRRDGNVLLPVDTSGRVLELLLVLNQHWERHRLQSTYNLVWCSHMCANTIQFAKSQLEWMAVTLGQEFEGGSGPSSGGGAAAAGGGANATTANKQGGGMRGNTTGGSHNNSNHPFQLRAVRLCTSVQQVEAVMEETAQDGNPNPTCVLASGLSLEGGPARDMFLKWADNPDNAIIFTDSSQCYVRSPTKATNANNKQQQRIMSSRSLADDEVAAVTTTTTTPDWMDTSSADPATTTVTTPVPTAPAMIHDDDDGSPERPSAAATAAAAGPTEEEEDVLTAAVVKKPSKWTTAGQLLYAWAKAKATGDEMDDVVAVDVPVPYRAALQGAELKAFLQAEEVARLRRKAEEEKRAMLRQVELAKGQLRLGEDDEQAKQQQQQQQQQQQMQQQQQQQQMQSSAPKASSRPRKKSRFDSSLFLKFSKPLHLTFEAIEEAAGIGQSDSAAKYGISEAVGRANEIQEDDYGIAVEPERFTDIVSGVDPSKFAGGTGRIGDEVLRRGFGYGVNDNVGGAKSKLSGKKKGGGGGVGARIVSEDEDQDDGADDLDDQEMEALDLSEGTGIIRGRNGRTPIKVSTALRKVEVLAEISYVPGLEGRVDARAARQSVRALQPREVIVLGGTRDEEMDVDRSTENNKIPELTDEVTLLAEAAKSFATGSRQIMTPSDGLSAELEVGHAAYSVRLIDTPYETKEEKEAEDYEHPEPIEPFETKLGVCNVSLLDSVATGQYSALDGSIVLAPRKQSATDDATSADVDKFCPSVYVSDGEVLLTDLRAELIAQGMKAEYSAHSGYSQLVVNGKIVVRKEHDQDGGGGDAGNLSVEGPLCEDFYAVRSIVCGQFVVL